MSRNHAKMFQSATLSIAVLLVLLVATPQVVSHSVLISPMPRNAVDRVLPAWRGGKFGNTTCEHPSTENSTTQKPGRCWGCTCVNGTEPCESAQTCTWFSQGCSIGCATCDGKESNPNKVDRCGSGTKATNNDPRYRTYNRDVPAGSEADWTKHNPWRAPGSAPVYDACGMAGGGPKWIPTQLSYIDTQFAVQGDLGSKVLPENPTGVVWQAGSLVEAKWSVRANHGGGYQYRLCPADEELTEACFQKMAIPFAGKTWLEWGDGSRQAINGTYLSTGTLPEGSTWAMQPLPYSDSHEASQFAPPCNETVDRTKNDTGACSGRFPWDVSIIDQLRIPPDTPAGRYVLGFRYDCEATAQIWSSCADLEIAA